MKNVYKECKVAYNREFTREGPIFILNCYLADFQRKLFSNLLILWVLVRLFSFIRFKDVIGCKIQKNFSWELSTGLTHTPGQLCVMHETFFQCDGIFGTLWSLPLVIIFFYSFCFCRHFFIALVVKFPPPIW